MRPHPIEGLFAAVAAMLIFQVVACPEPKGNSASVAAPASASAPAPPPIIEPVDDGNGVFYFEATDAQYRASLSAFYKSNPSKHCDLQGHTERNGVNGAITSGFILHCHDIAVNAQDVTVP